MQFDGAHHKLDITEIHIGNKCNHGVNSFQNVAATTQNNQPTKSVEQEKRFTDEKD